MAARKRGFDALQDVVDAVIRAEDLEGALSALCLALPLPFHAWWSCLTVSGDESSTIAGVWTAAGSSVVKPGMVISWNVTPEARAFVELVAQGRPIVLRIDEVDFGMIGELLQREGCASCGLLPMRPGAFDSTIVLASSSPDGFRAQDVPFLTGVQKGVEQHIVDLIERRPTRAEG